LLSCFAGVASALDNVALTINGGVAAGHSEGYGTVFADAIDGNRDGNYANGSVFHTQNSPVPGYWEVTFPAPRNLDHIRIFNRTDAIQGSVANFRIIATNGATQTFNQTFLPTIAADSNDSKAWGTSAVRGVVATKVRLERLSATTPAVDFLTFAEFEVWGSSGALTPRIPNGTITASPAGANSSIAAGADGDINGNLNAPGAHVYRSQTAAAGQFWEMEFTQDYQISHLLFFNRTDANDNVNIKISVRSAGGTEIWNTTKNTGRGAGTPFAFGQEIPVNIAGRKVRLETITTDFLAFSEIEAFGVVATPTPPTVQNNAATNVMASSAKVGGTVTNQGSNPPSVTLYYGPSDGGTDPLAWAGNVPLGTQAQGVPFTTTLTGLSQSTTYFYRCKATNTVGTAWAASSLSFATGSATPATLVVGLDTDVTGYTGFIGGTVANSGNDTPTLTLFWGPADGGTNPAAWANQLSLGQQTGAFSGYMVNLAPGQNYFRTVRATNGAGDVWSPVRPFTTPGTTSRPIRINEIHYDPDNKTEFVEFVELYNPTNAPVDLSGWHLLGGIDYTFPASVSIPPNGYKVVAQNAAAFQTKFGFMPLGPWLGGLKNSGDTVELRDASNTTVDKVAYEAGFPWPTLAAGGDRSAELIHPALDSDHGGNWRSSLAAPTPGAQNSVYATIAAPPIREVAHTPVAPIANQPVTITAKITDTDGVGTVTLSYQLVNPGAYIRKTDPAYATTWTNVPMFDDGTNGDAIAGDRIYTAVLPAALQTHRRLVRYRITAADVFGTSATAPYSDDECPNFAYFVYNGLPAWSGAFRPGDAAPYGTVNTYPATLLDDLPVYHLITNETDVLNSQYSSSFNHARMLGTIVYDGKVYDHINYNNRGEASTYVSGKNKWRFRFARARDFRAKDNLGQPYEETWDAMSFNGCASPWVPMHRGMSGMDEAVSHRLYDLAGVPTQRPHWIHFRVIRRASEVNTAGVTVSDPIAPGGTTNGQYSGDLWGLEQAFDDIDGSFLDERHLPDGNVYAIGGTTEKKHQGDAHPTDFSDWTTFQNNNSAGTNPTEAWWRANLDLPAFYSFCAVNRINGNVDLRAYFNYYAYHRQGDSRWVIIPYDLDMQFIAKTHWTSGIDGQTLYGVTQQYRAFFHPAIMVEYRNRSRELLDLLLSDSSVTGGQAAQLVDEYAQILNPTGAAQTWADVEAALWNKHPRTAGGGSHSGNTDHGNAFYWTTWNDARIGGNWTRWLRTPATIGNVDFEDQAAYLRDYMHNTWPGGTWTVGNGDQRGYGYKYLEFDATDTGVPNRPTISYIGGAGYPVNDLRFQSSAFSPTAGGGTFAAMQWRVGEISAPGIPLFDATRPRIYEVENLWTSAELPAFNATVTAPLTVAKAGHTYRARVRHKDTNGRWSRWSAPVQFVSGTPDLAVFQNSLRITELNYNPAPSTSAEFAAGFGSDDFEFIELKNISALTLDFTGVRFTKGVNFDFPAGYTLAPGAFALVVKNIAAFQFRYGHSHDAQIAGSYGTDNFSNTGEEVKLSYGAGNEIFSFTYADALPWPTEADGDGFTLVLRAPHTWPSHVPAANWRGSTLAGGSPGADDGTTYAAWKIAHGISNDLADPDGDGLGAVLEYSLGEDPAVPSRALLPKVIRAPDGTLTVTVNQSVPADDANFTIEVSTNVQAWAPAAATLQNAVTVGTTRTFTYVIAPTADPARFLRVRYQVP
jgi:hypothetical protein